MLLHCRTYIFGEEKLLHLGAELDIRKVHSEALAILNAFGFEKTAKPAVELSPA
jgi:hypothetical protein